MKDITYLDYNATTPVDAHVLQEMLPYFSKYFGNASSRNHPYGWVAAEAVLKSRQKIADSLACSHNEIFFTSGATEGNNLALKGVMRAYHRKGKHLITAETEHKAVLEVCLFLQKQGVEVTYLSVDSFGKINLEQLESSIRKDTVCVSIMWANNETGVIQDMYSIGQICEAGDTILMSDATQAVGKIPVYPKEAGVKILTFSGHKMYGPKGAGAMYVSRRNPRIVLSPEIHGGGHEDGFRSGTLNVPGIVGLGAALELTSADLSRESARLRQLRDYFEQHIIEALPEVFINGNASDRLTHVSNLLFKHVDAEGLISTFNRRIAVSSGSACSSATLEPSHVLLAQGLSERDAQSSIRFSLGKYTTTEDIDFTIQKVVEGVKKMRAESPIWQMFLEGIDVSE